MKKFIALLLAAVMCMSFVACGTSKNQSATIGDTLTNENFEVTLISAEFADALYMNQKSDNFCKPMSDEEREKELDFSLIGQNENTLLCYEIEFKFIGHSEVTDHFYSYGKPKVTFGDEYHFAEHYVSCVKNDSYPDWHMQTTDSSESAIKNMKINPVYLSGKYKALTEETYIARGFIAVPEKVRTDVQSALSISFDYLTDESFVIR